MNDETTERAFPVPDDASDMPGMTLRDYVAAKAMQALINNPLHVGSSEARIMIAEQAYRVADAMLKERKND